MSINGLQEIMLLPFGGYKQSGYSREKGIDGLKSYLQVKKRWNKSILKSIW